MPLATNTRPKERKPKKAKPPPTKLTRPAMKAMRIAAKGRFGAVASIFGIAGKTSAAIAEPRKARKIGMPITNEKSICFWSLY